jgi:hypothetical protein
VKPPRPSPRDDPPPTRRSPAGAINEVRVPQNVLSRDDRPRGERFDTRDRDLDYSRPRPIQTRRSPSLERPRRAPPVEIEDRNARSRSQEGNLYVRHLDRHVGEDRLWEVFSRYGEVVRCRIDTREDSFWAAGHV